MATTEEFLVQIGLDPASVQRLISAVQQAKTQAEGVTIDLTVTSNAAAVAEEVSAAAQKAGVEADHAMAIFEDGIRDAETALGDLKKGMLAISALAVAVGGFGFAQATKESEAYARANVILGFTQQELVAVQERLRKVADETNQTFVNVAESLFQVASAGFQGEAAIAAVTAASQAAVPAGIDTAVAFDAIATAMTNFGLTAGEAADKLVRVADLTRGTLGDVSGAIGLIGPVASQAGISLDEVGAAFSQITVQTGRAEVASTLLFNAILTFIAPAKEAEEVLRGIGIATGDAAFQSQDFAEKLKILKEAAAEGRIEIGRVFNRRALRGIQPLLAGLDDYNEKLIDIADSAGRTAEGSKVFFESAGPQWKALTTAIINAATAIGSDLLESLLPAIEGTRDFVLKNRDLIKWLGKAGLILAGLTATYLGYRLVMSQVRAATLLVSGVTKALNAVLTFESASLGVNVKAWAAKLTAEQSAAASPIIQFIRRIIAVLSIETSVVLASTAAWIKRAALGLYRTLLLGVKLLFLIPAMIAQIVLETAAIYSNTAARLANNLAAKDSTGLLKKLSGVLRANVSSMSAVGVAAGVVGAAIAGWKLGKVTNEWLGLAKATDAVVRGTSTGVQKIKSVILGGLIPVVGLATTYYALTAHAAREAAKVLTGPMKKALEETTDGQKVFNFWVRRGIHVTDAYGIAVGNLRQELAVLNKLEEEGKATTQDLARRAEITALIAKRYREVTNQSQRIIDLQKAIANSQQIINQTSEDWAKLVKRVEGEYRKLQTGVLSESLLDIERFDEDFDLILRRLAAFTSELAKLEAKRESLAEEAGSAREIEQNAEAIEEVTKRIAETQNVLSQDIALVQRRIIDNTRSFVSDLRTQAEEELRVYQEAADKQIAVEKRKVEAIETELEKLRTIRDRSIASAEKFIGRLEEAELRRRDTNLAEIIRLEQQFNAAVKEGIDTEERRIRVLQALRTELERLAAPTAEEVRLQQSLQQIREQIDKLRPDEDQERARERANTLLKKQKELSEDLQDAEAKRSVRRAEAEAALGRAAKTSAEAVDAFAKREDTIADLVGQRETLEGNILAIREKVAIEEEKITTEIGKQVTRVDELAKKQLGVLENAKEYVAILEKMRGAEPAAFKAAVEGVQTRFEGAIREVQKLAAQPLGEEAVPLEELQSIIDGTNEIADWMKSLKENLATVSTTMTAQKDVIIPAAERVTETFSELADVFEPSGTAVARMLEATNRFAPQLESFSDATATGLDAAARRLEQTTGRVAQAERRIAALEAPAGGGANGLPK